MIVSPPKPEPEDFRDYDAYRDALAEWEQDEGRPEDHPWELPPPPPYDERF